MAHSNSRRTFAAIRPAVVAAWVVALATLSGTPRAAGGDGAVPVLGEADSRAALGLESVAAGFGDLDEVTEAFDAQRRRVADLEARLAELESRSAPAIETIPPPEPKAATAAAADAEPDGKAGAKGAAQADEEPEAPHEVGSDLAMPSTWNHGWQGETFQKDFRVKVGGRLQIDETAFSKGDGPAQAPSEGGLTPTLRNAVNWRRARLRVDGRMYEVYDWVGEFDFANQLNANAQTLPTEAGLGNYVVPTELWLQMREVPWAGIIRVGNQKDPFGFEHMTSSRWTNFMERSYGQDLYEGPFNNGFVPAIRLLDTSDDERMTWSVAATKNTVNPFGFIANSSGNAAVGRITWLPYWEDDGRKLVHLGVSGRTSETVNDEVRFRARGDLRNGPPGPLNSIYIDSGLLTAPWMNQMGLEFVANNGPWSFQSEYFGCWLYDAVSDTRAFSGSPSTNPNYGTAGFQPQGAPVGTYFTNSGYAEILYFVTGESRAYDRLEARFDRPVPRNNFYIIRDGGGRVRLSEGAIQVGARYQYAGLSDGVINGGTLNALTLGVNWMFNPNSRLYFNYDFAYRDFTNNFNQNASGWITGFGTRLAFDF